MSKKLNLLILVGLLAFGVTSVSLAGGVKCFKVKNGTSAAEGITVYPLIGDTKQGSGLTAGETSPECVKIEFPDTGELGVYIEGSKKKYTSNWGTWHAWRAYTDRTVVVEVKSYTYTPVGINGFDQNVCQAKAEIAVHDSGGGVSYTRTLDVGSPLLHAAALCDATFNNTGTHEMT